MFHVGHGSQQNEMLHFSLKFDDLRSLFPGERASGTILSPGKKILTGFDIYICFCIKVLGFDCEVIKKAPLRLLWQKVFGKTSG